MDRSYHRKIGINMANSHSEEKNRLLMNTSNLGGLKELCVPEFHHFPRLPYEIRHKIVSIFKLFNISP